MNVRILFINFTILLFQLIFLTNVEASASWSVILKTLLKNCASPLHNNHQHNVEKRAFFDMFRLCLQRRALIAMDALVYDDVIPLVNGIDLVLYKKDIDNSTMTDVKRDKYQMRRLTINDDTKSWREKIFQRFLSIFKTHVFKVDIDHFLRRDQPIEDRADINDNSITGRGLLEGRRRHHNRRRNHFMPMMMMGLLLMGSVLIPMGFQFLAVLGGKALILAKLALMLSSIQGLKKIATSGVNYGLYHAGPPVDGWHDRSHQEQIAQYGVPYPTY